MGIRSWAARTFSAPERHEFRWGTSHTSAPYSILIRGMFGQEPNGGSSLASRREAMEIPSVLRGRNLICSISTLPLESVDRFNRVQPRQFFQQIDPNVANVVTLAQTIEDLLFDSVAWWKVTEFEGLYPARAIRIDPSQVSMKPPKDYKQGWLPSELPTHGGIWMNGDWTPFSRVIRFDSPNPPLMEVARRVILRAIRMDLAALRYADNPRAGGYFSPTDPIADPFAGDSGEIEEEKVQQFLDDWVAARKKHSDAYVPAALKYNTIQQPTPAELQLVQLEQHVSKEIAIAIGLDPEEVGVSTTSRTYANDVDRRKNKINDLYSPYMAAITQRLAMPDVTPPGVRVRFKLDDFLRADPRTRAEVNSIYIREGVIRREWVAADEGLPPEAVPAEPVRATPRPAIRAGEAMIGIEERSPSQLFQPLGGERE